MTRIAKMIADTTSKMLFRNAEVIAVTDHGGNFRAIELAGDALRKATWTVGDKVQVRTDPAAGLTLRTYTPFRWDTARGSTTLLAYTHGIGPGATWVRGLAPGVSCQLFGPRGSLKLDDLAGPILFVGDETSFALAAAWRDRNPEDQPVAEVFEVTDPGECRLPLDAIGLRSACLFRRQNDSAHLERLSATVVGLLRTHPDASLCLTGKAQSIASIRRELKASDLAGRPIRVKAYWDENRSGLD
ncbi:MAG: siderophore-interacting protein [Acidimicrobiales bacterium]